MDFVRPSIFIFSPVPWSGLRQRHQALAAGLSRAGHAVTYVEPLVTPGFSVVCRRETPSLTVVSIRLPFPATAHPAVGLFGSSTGIFRCHVRRVGAGSATRAWQPSPAGPGGRSSMTGVTATVFSRASARRCGRDMNAISAGAPI